jgi:hypothetical protein
MAERCQSTTSIKAAEAISANGMIVPIVLVRTRATNDRLEWTATTSVIRSRLTQ